MKPVPSGGRISLPTSPAEWAGFYRGHLLDFVMPFWMHHAIDEQCGGLMTCVDDDGRIQSTDKYIWSQARGLWTFSALYRRIENRSEWLDVAHGLFNFCRDFGRDEEGWWRFRTARDGQTTDGPL